MEIKLVREINPIFINYINLNIYTTSGNTEKIYFLKIGKNQLAL